MSGATGYGTETTLSRAETLRSRGYPADVVAGSGHRRAGQGHQVDDLDDLPAVEVEHQVVPDATPASCALPGCSSSLPPGRRRYCSADHADEAERRRARHKTQREAKKRKAARKARPSRSSVPAAKAEPPSSDRPRPGVVELVGELLATGAVAEVELSVDGTLVVARAR